MTWGRGPFTATVTPAPARDRNGDPIEESSSALDEGSWDVPGCKLAPRGSTTGDFKQERVGTKWEIYAPAGYEFPAGATVEIAGVTARVDGDAESWGGPGQVVPIERIRG